MNTLNNNSKSTYSQKNVKQIFVKFDPTTNDLVNRFIDLEQGHSPLYIQGAARFSTCQNALSVLSRLDSDIANVLVFTKTRVEKQLYEQLRKEIDTHRDNLVREKYSDNTSSTSVPSIYTCEIKFYAHCTREPVRFKTTPEEWSRVVAQLNDIKVWRASFREWKNDKMIERIFKSDSWCEAQAWIDS